VSAFLNPHLLWGLLLLAAPIIIHLLNKRRFEMHHWAAMDFLLKADVRNRRRVRIEDLVLLLLRAAVIAAAVFLVARPVVQGLGAGGEAVRTIVLDDSFSMEYRPGVASALERAREAASSEVEEAIGARARIAVRRGTRPSEEVGKVVGTVKGGEVIAPASGPAPSAKGAAAGKSSGSGGPPAIPEEEGAGQTSRLLAAIRSLSAADGSLRLAEALELEAKEMEESRGREPRALSVISDFRRSDWLAASGELRSSLREAFDRLKRVGQDQARIRLVQVGDPRKENLAVSRVAVDALQPVAGKPVSITVEVKNLGAEEKRGLSGELEVGDPQNPSQRIPLPPFPAIPPGGSASVEVDHVFAEPGEYPLSAHIDEDRLARDDRAYAVALVRQALSVLVVDGDPGAGRLRGEAGFLAAALAPSGGAATGIRPEVVRGPLAEEMLKGRDVVLLLNCEEVSVAERDALERFTRAGGGLGFFLGNKVRAQSYREVLGDGGVFPALLNSPVQPGAGARIDFGDMSHPALAVYRGLRDASVERITAARYFDLTPGPETRVVANYSDGGRTPAVLERTLGAGRTALFNISADRDWTDWPTDPSYPVVLQEWVRYLAPHRGEARALKVGDAISFQVEEGAAPAVVDPRGTRQPAVLGQGSARFERTELAGLYRAVSAGAGGISSRGEESGHWFAVNRPLEESDLTPATEGELRRALAGVGVPITFSGSAAAADRDRREGDLWRWLALSAGLLLLTELGAAYWFGRR
jgi:hypothetical protein